LRRKKKEQKEWWRHTVPYTIFLKVSLDPHVMSFLLLIGVALLLPDEEITKSEFFLKYKKVQSNYLGYQKNTQPTVKTKIKK
jgi:hypothetical protein